MLRLLDFYQYDMGEFLPAHLNANGEYGFDVDAYLLDSTRHACIFMADGNIAGFGMVDRNVKLPSSDYWMAQFFVMKLYRRGGIGTLAAHSLFDRFRGQWEVGQLRSNRPAQAFWRRSIESYTGGAFVEHDMNDPRWNGLVQAFSSMKA